MYKLKLIRHDYNEPQRGKYQYYREAVNAQHCSLTYVNSGKNISNTQELMKTLLYMDVIQNSNVSLIEISDFDSHYKYQKIENNSAYHSAEATKTGLKVWQYFSIGPVKDIALSEGAVFSTSHNVASEFFSIK